MSEAVSGEGGPVGWRRVATALGLLAAVAACSPSTGASGAGGDQTGGGAGAGGAAGGDGGAGGAAGGQGGTGAEGTLGGFGGFGAITSADAGPGCGSVSIDTSVEEVVIPGNVLVIFDQSDSMNRADFNGQVRWLAASDAVVAALAPNGDALTIGAVFFPSVDSIPIGFGGCDLNSVSAIDDAASPNPQIPFMPGTQFLDAWVRHWQSNPLRLSTPIDAGLIRGDEALTKTPRTGKTVILFVTDGEPTCNTGTTRTDLPAKWLSQSMETYVVGLPGSGTAVLQDIATAGGTGQYFLPTDAAQLTQQISSITSKIVQRSLNSCEIKFGEPPADPDLVRLLVTDSASGQQYAVNPGSDGWELAADLSRASLLGATCDDALNGRFSTISFAFGCVNVPVLR